MNELTQLRLEQTGSRRDVRTASDSRFLALHLASVDGAFVHTSGAGESCVLLLGGTFDLRGGATQWPNRGARTTPFQGRPVAVFLPPHTEFEARNGTGEVLVVEARKPEAPKVEGRAALHQSPLLPLAGSGKSFDPTRGEWLPAESFPTAAESLPPRRIAQHACGPVRVERVFGADYKAESVCVDEAVVPAGATLDLALLPLPASADEALLFVRSDGTTTVAFEGASLAVAGDAAFRARGPLSSLRVTATAGACYVVLATAPK